VLKDLLVVVITAALGWGIGTQVSFRWDDAKRKRDLDLAAIARFYDSYGEFLEVWRLWNTHKRHGSGVPHAEVRWTCLQHASAVEGRFESLLVKLTVERRLSAREIVLLGCFREASQCLRERIRVDQQLDWSTRVSTDAREYRQYQAFKCLAAFLAEMLQRNRTRWVVGQRSTDSPSEVERRQALLAVTVGERRLRWSAVRHCWPSPSANAVWTGCSWPSANSVLRLPVPARTAIDISSKRMSGSVRACAVPLITMRVSAVE
jgi:hypothetical protein